jgi:hypothetical protein
MPGTRVAFAAGSGPDTRSYRVECSKLERILPEAPALDRPNGCAAAR